MDKAGHDPFRDNLRHADVIALYDYWAAQRQAAVTGDLPDKQFFGGGEIARWARDLVIMRARGRGFSYAFYGMSFKQAFGIDMTGAPLDQLPRAEASILNAEYKLVIEQRKPSWRLYTAWFGDELQTWERLTLPLVDHSVARAGVVAPVTLLLAAAYRIVAAPTLASRGLRAQSL